MLLPARMVEKPWGRDLLPAPFTAPARKRIGEIWFEPPAALDALLVKYLFTGEKLSVQVHPGGPQGKEECWLVIAAEPGAALGIGFREPIAPDAMRAAALDSSIEHLLEWHTVRPGDFFYIPAGTVHAIGAGVSLIEVQQNHDVTYRLYDYGRPRELHLDAGIAVTKGVPHDPALRTHLRGRGAVTLVDGPLFRLDRIEGDVPDEVARRYRGPLLVVPLGGAVSLSGEPVAPGQCALAQAIADVAVADDASCLLAQPCAGIA
jgi:mannose-6-phosphate isomerase